MTTISGVLRSNGNKTRIILRAFAISLVLGYSYLVPLECTLAEEQRASLTPAETDREIASLLSRIEAALAQDHMASLDALVEMSFAAKSLESSASTEGRRLINDFPARLQKHAEQELNVGNTIQCWQHYEEDQPHSVCGVLLLVFQTRRERISAIEFGEAELHRA